MVVVPEVKVLTTGAEDSEGTTGTLELEGLAGPVELEGTTGTLELEGLAGPVELEGTTGTLELEGLAGLLELEGAPGLLELTLPVELLTAGALVGFVLVARVEQGYVVVSQIVVVVH